jgi:hypothetical protein
MYSLFALTPAGTPIFTDIDCRMRYSGLGRPRRPAVFIRVIDGTQAAWYRIESQYRVICGCDLGNLTVTCFGRALSEKLQRGKKYVP